LSGAAPSPRSISEDGDEYEYEDEIRDA